MRAELLQAIKAFAESQLPTSELGDWWEKHALEVKAELDRASYLAISKKGFAGLRWALEKEGIAFQPSAGHCQVCGEPLFIVEPGKTTKEQIVAFARRSKLKGAEQAIESGWLHPGVYCQNGCTYRLWNFR